MNHHRTMLRRMVLMGGEVEPPGTLHIYTDSEGGTFDPSWAFSDASVMTVNWGDQTAKQSHATTLSHTYAAGSGRKLVRFYCPDWTKLTTFNTMDDECVLSVPSFSVCSAITVIQLHSGAWWAPENHFSGSIPSFAGLVSLATLQLNGNLLTGSLPSFATEISLNTFDISTNQLSGIIPSFATNTALTSFSAQRNQFSGYAAGGFATQKFLVSLNFQTNNLTEASVDGILADCVTSLGIPGRSVCTVTLDGVGNSAPSAAGAASILTLEAAGWTVVHN